MKALIKVSAVLAVSLFATAPAFADGFKDCTKLEKAKWKPASEAEAKAKELGYEVRRSKVEGSCYEVYGVKEGKLYELFYSPEDLSLKKTIAKLRPLNPEVYACSSRSQRRTTRQQPFRPIKMRRTRSRCGTGRCARFTGRLPSSCCWRGSRPANPTACTASRATPSSC